MLVDDKLDLEHYPAFYLLLGFVLELSLKSICLTGGIKEKKVRAHGHDIHKLYVEAMQIGSLPTAMTPVGQLILIFRDDHMKFTFRYPKNVEIIHVPPPQGCFNRAKWLVDKADELASMNCRSE